MVRDRGTLKWSSILLQEHVNALDDIWHAAEHKKKLILDEQELDEINHICNEALGNNLKIEVTYYNNYDYKKAIGYDQDFNVMNKEIKINDIVIRTDDLLDMKVKK